jgi:hypothetical protein
MVRKLRVEYPGAIYHVMNRGDQREKANMLSYQVMANLEQMGWKDCPRF